MKKFTALLLAVLMLMTSVSALADELVAHYDFEDASNLGKDVSGNGNDLIVVGSGSAASTDNAYDGEGALALDGTYGLTTETTLDFTDYLTDFTISFSAQYNDNLNEVNRVISSGYNGCQCGMCFVLGEFSGMGLTLKGIIGDSAQDMWGRMDATNCGDTADYHWYVVTYDSATQIVTAYVDGEERVSNKGINVDTSCDAFGFTVGGQYVSWTGGLEASFIGLVDDIRIFDYVVEDLKDIYTVGVKYYVKAKADRWNMDGGKPLNVNVSYFNSLGEFETLYPNFINRVYLNGREDGGILIDPANYTITQNRGGTLTLSIDPAFLKEHASDGANSIVVYWENDGYYVTSNFVAFTGSLVAHYDFEDAANLGRDVSGNGNDLVVKGNPVAIADAPVGTGAVMFDGMSALISESVTGDYTDSLNSYTLSFYARHEGKVGEHYRVFSSGYNGCQDGICSMLGKYDGNATHMVYQPIIGDSGRDFWGRMNQYTTMTEELDAWHWYVCTFDATTKTVTAWIDGVLCGTVECVNPAVTCDTFGPAVGGGYTPWQDQIAQGFVGSVDDVRVYDYAIDDASQIYGE